MNPSPPLGNHRSRWDMAGMQEVSCPDAVADEIGHAQYAILGWHDADEHANIACMGLKGHFPIHMDLHHARYIKVD